MKKPILLLLTTLLYLVGVSQVAINTSGATATASSMLDISSSTAGILIPRMLTAQKNAIASPANGLLVYDTETDSFWYYDGTSSGWNEVITSASSSINNLTDGKSNGTNVFIGDNAGINTTNFDNTAVGISALTTNTQGNGNSAIGYNTLSQTTTGSENTANGAYSLYSNTTGVANTAIGKGALYNNTTGTFNTVLGVRANSNNQTGWNNTIIGYEAGKSTSLHNKSGNIFLGYKAGFNETGSNKLYIENSNSSTPLIGGDFANDSIFLNGIVRISGGSPGTDKILTSDANGNATWENNAAAYDINGLSDGRSDGNSIFLGDGAGVSDDLTSNHNIGIGKNSLNSVTTGSANIAIGKNSLSNSTTTFASIAIGEDALSVSTDKSGLAIGYEALKNNGTGATLPQHSSTNIAIGFQSLKANTIGYSNITLGSQSLISNTTGYQNTAIGASSLYSNITGYQNTAIGYRTLKSNTESNNIAIGSQNMENNTTGYSNVSIGVLSLYKSQSGHYNIAMGYSALYNNLTGSGNISIGSYSDFYNQNGDNNTIIGQEAGKGISAHTKSGNIFLGYKAGFNETGSDKLYIENSDSPTPLIGGDFSSDEVYLNGKVGIGTSTPYTQLDVTFSSPINNTNPIAIFQTSGAGISAAPIRLQNSSGKKFNFGITSDPDNSFAIAYSNNISTGSDLFRLSSTGNLAIGSHTAQAKLDIDGQIKIRGGVPGNGKILTSDATGKATWESATWATNINDLTDGKSDTYSIFIGTNAGLNDDGSNNQNTGTGIDALKANTSGTNNTATGYLSLNLTTGSNYNSAFGSKSLEFSTGERNTAMGYFSLHSNTTGSYNTSIGYRTGYSNQTGDYNTYLGYNARVNNTIAKSNSTAIGNDAIITASNQVRIGNASVTSIGGYADWTNVSDRRFKSNISENVNGLDFILKLRPVTYNLDVEKINDFLGVENSASVNKEKSNIRQSGFIAQEVEQAAKEIGYEFSGVDTPDNNSDHYGIRYAEFVIPLVKAVQELEANSKRQESAINELKEENLRLQEMVKSLINTRNK